MRESSALAALREYLVNTNPPVLFENDGRAPLTLSGPVALTDTIRGDQGRAGS